MNDGGDRIKLLGQVHLSYRVVEVSLDGEKQSIAVASRRIIRVKLKGKLEVFSGTLSVPTVGEHRICECRVRLGQSLIDPGHHVLGSKRSVGRQKGIAVRQSGIGESVVRVLLDRAASKCVIAIRRPSSVLLSRK